MSRLAIIAVVALVLLTTFGTSAWAAGTLVVSQIYGGGGNTGAPFKNDYIELFNRGAVAVSVAGWSVQYAPAASSTWQTTVLSGTIPAGGYYLVREGAGAGGNGADLPMPLDALGSIAMSLSDGKVALVNNSTPLTGTCPSDANIIDLVGYGGANCSETSPTGSLNNTTADFRNSGGCKDTENNLADFTITAPAPRNSATAIHSCEYTLVVTLDPPGGGSVAKVPDLGLYSDGSSVQLTATPTPGYHFVEWSGDAAGATNPVAVTMDANKSVTAHFAPFPGPGNIVISQLYGGGGNAGATYRRDFIELYNRGPGPVDVTGWTVQYSPATGAGEWTMTTLLGTIPQGRYYLVAEAQGVGGTDDLPTPDIIHDIQVNAIEGKVAVVRNNIPLSGACPSGPDIADMVGYGDANCFEANPVIALDNVTAAHRVDDGCRDTDDNAADFTAAAPTPPRNSLSPRNLCAFWVGVDDRATTEFSLGRLAPNPVSGMLRVPFALPREAAVQLDVIDIQGRMVARLAEGTFPSGQHEVMWNSAANGGGARSGVYFIRLQVPGEALVRRVIVTR